MNNAMNNAINVYEFYLRNPVPFNDRSMIIGQELKLTNITNIGSVALCDIEFVKNKSQTGPKVMFHTNILQLQEKVFDYLDKNISDESTGSFMKINIKGPYSNLFYEVRRRELTLESETYILVGYSFSKKGSLFSMSVKENNLLDHRTYTNDTPEIVLPQVYFIQVIKIGPQNTDTSFVNKTMKSIYNWFYGIKEQYIIQ
jgi:hypothetical protein